MPTTAQFDRIPRLFLGGVGLVLLAAAALKTSGLSYDAIAKSGTMNAPLAQTYLILFEAVLAVWLLSGWRAVAAWLTAGCTFTGFAAFSLYAAWVGQASCGCFGSVQVSPWITACFDIGILGGLWFFRPLHTTVPGDYRPELARAVRTVVGFSLGVVAVAGIATGASYAAFGSPEKALARLRGKVLVATPGLVQLGHGKTDDELVGQIQLENLSDIPIRVISGTADCRCVSDSDLPITISPHGQATLSVKMRLRSQTGGELTRMLTLVCDHPQQRVVKARVQAFVDLE